MNVVGLCQRPPTSVWKPMKPVFPRNSTDHRSDLGLLVVEAISIDWRYLAVAVLTLVTYFLSAWALSEDLDNYEWITILPLPTLYSTSVSLFYFLLPANLLSQAAIFVIFGIGMYALLLTSNIFSVAKGRTIQLLYAAHAIALFFILIISLLFTNTIFSLRIPFWLNGLLVGLIHFPLVLISLWSTNLESFVSKAILRYSFFIVLLLVEFTLFLSLLPYPVWHSSLFIMTFLYIALGILQSYLHGRFFKSTVNEYFLLTIFMIVIFTALFPLK